MCRSALGVAAAMLGPVAAAARPMRGAPALLQGEASLDSIRTLCIRHSRTGEKYRGVYHDGDAYVPEAMAMLNWVLRDIHADETYRMHPRLIDALARAQRRCGAGELLITSGYRSRETNERLRRRTGRAVLNSYHLRGMAADVYSPDARPLDIARSARRSGAGGVGYYPRHGFVHIDVGPRRSWRG